MELVGVTLANKMVQISGGQICNTPSVTPHCVLTPEAKFPSSATQLPQTPPLPHSPLW